MGSYQSISPYKTIPITTSNFIALPLLWRDWYLIVALLSLFFVLLTVGELLRMLFDNIRTGKTEDDWL